MVVKENKEVRLELQDLLPQISFFGGITKPELEEILEYMYMMRVEKGDYLYREGDSPGDLYIVVDGKMDFFILDELVAKSKLGQLCGMSASIGIQKQVVTAKVVEDLRVAVISKKFFSKIRRGNPELFTKIVLNVARDLARDLNFLRKYVEGTKSCKC